LADIHKAVANTRTLLDESQALMNKADIIASQIAGQ
jgi:hypothetical protein